MRGEVPGIDAHGTDKCLEPPGTPCAAPNPKYARKSKFLSGKFPPLSQSGGRAGAEAAFSGWCCCKPGVSCSVGGNAESGSFRVEAGAFCSISGSSSPGKEDKDRRCFLPQFGEVQLHVPWSRARVGDGDVGQG